MTANSAEAGGGGAGETAGVKVKKKCGPGHARAFVNPALQLARPRRGPPMNPVERIALLIGPDARHARRVLEKAVGQADFANGAARAEVVAGEGHNFGEDERECRLGQDTETPVQPKDVAGFHQQRPELVIAAPEKLDAVAEHFDFAGGQAGQGQASARGFEARRRLGQSVAGEGVFHQEPRDGQAAGVVDGDFDFDAAADFQNVIAA